MEPVLAYLEQQMTAPEVHRIGRGTVSVYSSRCPGKETPNEDAVAVVPLHGDSAVLVVADGMGGGAAGEKASAIAVETIATSVQAYDGSDQQLLRTSILNGIEQANHAVQKLALGAATTLALVEIQGPTIRPYHVGDSLILVVGNRGKNKLQTVSHSPVGYGVEAGLLDEAEALHHEERHLVLNLVGMSEMRIEVGAPLTLARRDTLLVATDGLSDNLHIDEITQRIRKGDLLRCTRQLASDARSRMMDQNDTTPSKPDDLTFVAYRLT